MKALLHPPTRKTGIPYNGRYDVSFDGEIIVKGSRDPEPDLARALLAKGITGTIAVHDANTGKHRSTVDIEKAAKVRTEERPHGPRFVKYQQAVVDPADLKDAHDACHSWVHALARPAPEHTDQVR